MHVFLDETSANADTTHRLHLGPFCSSESLQSEHTQRRQGANSQSASRSAGVAASQMCVAQGCPVVQSVGQLLTLDQSNSPRCVSFQRGPRQCSIVASGPTMIERD